MLDPTGFELPPIPPKRYFAIGEVSKLCEIKPHVLRYWETVFPQLKPVKRRGRRYYQRHEVKLIRHISRMLYKEGYTISSARRQLEEMSDDNLEIDLKTRNAAKDTEWSSRMVSQLIDELTEVQQILS